MHRKPCGLHRRSHNRRCIHRNHRMGSHTQTLQITTPQPQRSPLDKALRGFSVPPNPKKFSPATPAPSVLRTSVGIARYAHSPHKGLTPFDLTNTAPRQRLGHTSSLRSPTSDHKPPNNTNPHPQQPTRRHLTMLALLHCLTYP